ncbi:unnamed protein product, partial [Mesorhabditis spiculigera]
MWVPQRTTCRPLAGETFARMSSTLTPYLDAVRATLQAAFCLEQFSSNRIERHDKPEIEVRTAQETILTPVTIARNKQERVLIEPSINSVRVSISMKKADELEKILAHGYTRLMAQRADDFMILRRKPIKGYDISFLATNTLTSTMYKHKLIDFIIHFMQEIDKDISDMKITLNARARCVSEEFLKAFN